LRTQLGEDTASLAPMARAAFVEAAHQAEALYAHTAAARHYRSALDLTPENDVKEQAELLFGEAKALFKAYTHDEQQLLNAVEAQVRVEDWETAAAAERLLSAWYADIEVRGEDSRAHLARAAEYAARVPPGEAMCEIAADQAFDLIVSGHAEQALAIANRTIPIADEAGLEVGSAMHRMWRGLARITLGDTEGIGDIRTAADTLARHSHPTTVTAYGNLADALRGFGDIPAADAALAAAREWAMRFNSPASDWIVTEQAVQAYHAAHWDTAQRLLAEIDIIGGFNEVQARVTTGRIALAHGDYMRALADADAIIAFSVSNENNEVYFYGVALRTACYISQGCGGDALRSAEEFLGRWHQGGGMVNRATELCEVVPVLANAGHVHAIRDAALLLPEANHWRDALLAIVDQRYAAAAALYEQIGSRPLAADAHLLAARQATDEGRTADAHQHAEAVLAFAEQTGATLYQQRAEVFVKASA
jgi:hypothetical protein